MMKLNKIATAITRIGSQYSEQIIEALLFRHHINTIHHKMPLAI